LNRLDGIVEERDQRSVRRLIEVLDTQVVFDLGDARLEHTDSALLLVNLVVDLWFEPLGDLCELGEPPVGLPVAGARDDQRCACFVDKDRVDLVDNGEESLALHQIALLPGHIVAQVVEAELVVGAVGDVGGVLFTPLLWGLPSQDAAGGRTQGAEDTTHQVALILRQKVVDRDDVHALACDGIQECGQRGHQRLALTGLHFGDVALMQCRTAHDLHIEVAHAKRARCRLAHGSERLGKQVVERLTLGIPRLKLSELLVQFVIAECLVIVFECVDLVGDSAQTLDDATLADAQDVVENSSHVSTFSSARAPAHGAHLPHSTCSTARGQASGCFLSFLLGCSRGTCASVTAATTAPPAALTASIAARRVAPVVITSSTSTTVRPCTSDWSAYMAAVRLPARSARLSPR
jgi:hypothetical protein